MVGPWQLFKRSLVAYRQWWRTLVAAVAVVAVPVILLSNGVVDPASDTSMAAYLALAQLVMYMALIQTIIWKEAKQPTGVKAAYYQGSAALLRLILLFLLFVVMALPLLIGLLVLAAGLSGSIQLGAVEKLLLALAAVLIGTPSVLMLTRGFGAVYLLFGTDLGPVEALRRFRARSNHKVRALLGRLAALLVFILALVAVPAVVLLGLQSWTGWVGFNVILQILVSLTLLPITHIYLYLLAREASA